MEFFFSLSFSLPEANAIKKKKKKKEKENGIDLEREGRKKGQTTRNQLLLPEGHAKLGMAVAVLRSYL